MLDTTKKVVGSSVTLGMGNAIMGAIPGGSAVMAGPMGKASNMLGIATTGMYAKDVLDVMQKPKTNKW